MLPTICGASPPLPEEKSSLPIISPSAWGAGHRPKKSARVLLHTRQPLMSTASGGRASPQLPWDAPEVNGFRLLTCQSYTFTMSKQQSILPSDFSPERKPQHFLRNDEDTPYLSSVCAPCLTEFLTRMPSSATCPSVLRLQTPVPGAELWSGQQSPRIPGSAPGTQTPRYPQIFWDVHSTSLPKTLHPRLWLVCRDTWPHNDLAKEFQQNGDKEVRLQ